MSGMANALRARVTNGRIVPGVELDELADEDREKLHAAIKRGLEQGRRGEARPIEEALADLRNRR